MVAGNLGSAADEFICYIINLPPIYTKVWIAEIANDFLMLVLILAKGYSTMRKCDDKKNGIVCRLTVLLVKDSALYFFV